MSWIIAIVVGASIGLVVAKVRKVGGDEFVVFALAGSAIAEGANFARLIGDWTAWIFALAFSIVVIRAVAYAVTPRERRNGHRRKDDKETAETIRDIIEKYRNTFVH